MFQISITPLRFNKPRSKSCVLIFSFVAFEAYPLLIPQGTKEKRIDTDFYVEGYATTFDKPYLLYEYDGQKYFERIDRNALVGADMSDVIMQYDHSETS